MTIQVSNKKGAFFGKGAFLEEGAVGGERGKGQDENFVWRVISIGD